VALSQPWWGFSSGAGVPGRRRAAVAGGGRRGGGLENGAGGRFVPGSWAARVADHYHSASEHGIIGRRIDTVVAVSPAWRGRPDTARARRLALAVREGPHGRHGGEDHWYVRVKEGDAGWRR
jgi:hypothetical protein